MIGDILEKVSKYLKDWYIQTRFHAPEDGTEDLWQLLYPEHFVNVQLKRHDKERKENEIAIVASTMRAGLLKHIDDPASQVHIFEKPPEPHGKNCTDSIISELLDIFCPIQHGDGTFMEPKMILINGAPGIGKTTLCKEIAYRWAKGSLLINHSFVFLLFLRDPGMQKIYELKDLIHFFYGFDPAAATLSAQFAQSLIKNENSNVTLLLDGFDEFSNTDKNLLVNKIINRKLLAQTKLVITSRPVSSEKLQKVADVTVEMLGFTEESKASFIEKELDGYQDKKGQLNLILNACYDVNSSCYFPIMMTILVCTIKHHDELPNDGAELYEKFVILTISRFLNKLNRNSTPPITDMCLKNLPHVYKCYFYNLSKLAFEFIKVNKIVFTKKDVEEICRNFDLADYHGLGLLNYTECTKYLDFNKCIYYNFLHLSVQEFLAAYYIDSLEISEQFQLLKSTFFAGSYLQTWITFLQMNKSKVNRSLRSEIYSYSLGASSESECQVMSMVDNLSLFEEVCIAKIIGIFHMLCIMNTEHGLYELDLWISNYDAFCFLTNDVHYQNGTIKIYLSLCSIDDSHSQSIQVFLLDANIRNRVYHRLITKLGQNQNVSVVLVSDSALLAYRAKPHQICNALIMTNDSLRDILLRDCHITKEVADHVSLYLKNHTMTKLVSITNWNRKTAAMQQEPLSDIVISFKSITNLLSIDLDSNQLPETVLYDLANAIENNIDLEVVSLNNNNLKSSAHVILQALNQLSKLKRLYLSSNDLSSENFGPLLADVIHNNNSLKVLNLSFNNLHLSGNAVLKALSKVSHLEVLNLNQTNLSSKVIADLIDAVKSNTSLKALHLKGNNLHSSACKMLQALKQHSQLVHLDLGDNKMSEKVVDDLANVIRNNNCLEWLCLSDNNLQSSVTVVLQALKMLSSLRKLMLSNNNIPGIVAKDFADVIKNNTKIEELSVDGNHFGSSLTVILNALKNVSTLTTLNLGHNNMSGKVVDDLAHVIIYNPYLEALFMNDNNLQSSVSVVLEALKNTSKLKCLDLGSNNMTGFSLDDFKGVVKSNVSLEEIYLNDNNLELSEIGIILQTLQCISCLRVLDLRNIRMSGRVAEYLADVIKHNSLLEKVRLSNNNMGSYIATVLLALKNLSNLRILYLNYSKLSREAVHNVAAIIDANIHMEVLHLSGNKLQSSAPLVLQSLKQVPNLKVLDFSDNMITEDGVECLADLIKNSTCLELLFLSNNDLQLSSAVILQALKKISTLKKLNLFGNNLPKEVDQHLADVVTNNANLEVLFLGENNGLQSSAVVNALAQLSSLKVLDLGNNNLPKQAVQTLSSVINSNIGLEVLFLNNNDLMASITLILQALKRISNLQKLYLCKTNLPLEVANDLADVVNSNPCLEDLDVSCNANLYSHAFLKALTESANLKNISFSTNNMSEEAADYIVNISKNNLRMEIFSLDGDNLKSSAAKNICCALSYYKQINTQGMSVCGSRYLKDSVGCSHLEKLELISLKLSFNAILYILKGLLNLKALTLVSCHISSLSDKSIDMVARNTFLEELSLCYCTEPTALVVIQRLKAISSVKRLNLHGNNMSGKVATDLSDMISNNTFLEEIFLGSNNLQSSAKVVLQALKGISCLKKLDLNNNNTSGLVVDDLADVIRNNTCLEELYLCNNNLQASANVVLKALQNNSGLKGLNLEANNMPAKVVDDLVNVIKANTGLHTLCLGFNGLHSSAAVIVQAMKKLTQLKLLVVGNSLSSNIVDDLADVIKNNSGLELLSLCGISLQSAGSAVLQALKEITNLAVLELSDNLIPENIFHDMSYGCHSSSLIWLNLSGNNLPISIAQQADSNVQALFFNNANLTVTAINNLLATIDHNHRITDLWLGDNSIQNGLLGITKQCSVLPKLSSLELSHNSCDASEVAKLASNVSIISSLKSLMFGGITLSSKEYFYIRVLTIFDALNSAEKIYNINELFEAVTLEMQKCLRGHSIRYFFTAKCKLPLATHFPLHCHVNVYKVVHAIEQWFKCTTTALLTAKSSLQNLTQVQSEIIASTLSNCIKTLAVLDLEYSNIGGCAASKLAQSIQHNNELEQLWLRGNVLCDEGAELILNSLKCLETLQVLDLSFNNISCKSSDGLAAVIKSNNFLEQLWLEGNCLQTAGVVKISNALEKHYNLRLLSLSKNGITEYASEAIYSIVCSNVSIEVLMLGFNFLQSFGICSSKPSISHCCLTRLLKLDLFNNHITSEHAVRLADVIKNCTNLQELLLGDNMLETNGTLEILKAIKTICTLRILSLGNNKIAKDAAGIISDVISIHFDLTILLLGGNELQSDGVKMIAEAANNNEALQLLVVCDNGVDDQTKEDIKVMLSSNADLHLYI